MNEKKFLKESGYLMPISME